MLEGVKHVIPVLSGKGGVGKSTVAVQLALALRQKGFKVGLLDVDLCGPTVPSFLGVEGGQIHQSQDGWVPVYLDQSKSLSVMSIGFLLKNNNDAVIWRGPKKTGMIRQFLNDVLWEDRDFLIIDTPPGTSDEHITVVEHIREVCDGAVIVTTPQAVSLEDVRKEITFCRKTQIPILGLIENMSGYVCSHCSECTNIFSSGGGQSLSEHANVPFLGSVAIDPKVSQVNMLESFPNSPVALSFNNITNKLISSLSVSS